MKKSLIALAVVATFSAPAFADVSVYGLLDAVVANVSGTGLKGQTLVLSGGLASSRLGVKATEDVGDGLTGIAVMEFDVDSQDSTGVIAARQKLLGLSSASMGTVAAGYLQTTGYDFAAKYDPTAGSLVSPLQNMTKGIATALIGNQAGAARAQRALAYISPNMSGFTVAVNHAMTLVRTGNLGVASATDTNTTATLLSANYEAGALAAGGVYASTSNSSGNGGSAADVKEYALGLSYDLGSAKLSGTYQSSNINAATSPAKDKSKIYSLSGVIPAGSGAAVLSYAHATNGTAVDSNGTSYTAGYLHSMSKTLTAYAAYSHTTEGSATNAYSVANGAVAGPVVTASTGHVTAGGSTSLVAVGLSKKF